MSSLESEVLEAKSRYQASVSFTNEIPTTLSALPQFPINDKFTLNQDEAWYTLAIEIQAPIESVMLQVRIGKLNVNSSFEKLSSRVVTSWGTRVLTSWGGCPNL